MNVGMLWFNNKNLDLSVKVKEAAEYYVKKYERTPDLCLVHPSMMKSDMRINASFFVDFSRGKLLVKPYRPVLPGCIWIGIEDKS